MKPTRADPIFQIYVLEGEPDEDPFSSAHSSSYLYRESHIHRPMIGTPQSNGTRELNWSDSNGQRPEISNHPLSLPSGERRNSPNFRREQATGSFSK